MGKSKNRDIRWGDGYIQTKTLASGSERYYARWREPDPIRGSVLRSRGFDTETAARQFLQANSDARREGSYETESTITLSEAVSQLAEVRLEQGKWAPNTYQTNKIFQKNLIDPQLGKIRVTRLRPKQVQDWADALSKNRSASTVRSTLSIVRGALRRMMQLGVIAQNPAEPAEVRERTRGRTSSWSLEEVHKILEASESDPLMHVFYLIGFNTGMRPGEIRALRWEDVDWETNAITCARTITKDERGREIVGETTKTGRSRVIVVGQAIADKLSAWKARQNERRLLHVDWKDTMIIDRGNGEFLPGTTLISRHNATFQKIDVPRYPPHVMRHTATTLEDESGASAGVTQARLGHASGAMTARYRHTQIQAQKATAEHMAQLLLNDDSDTTTSEETASN